MAIKKNDLLHMMNRLLLLACFGVLQTLAACGDLAVKTPPVQTTYGPFAFVSGCFGRAEIADPANPLPVRDLASYGEGPHPGEAYMLFPEARFREEAGATPPKFDVRTREESDGGMSILFTYGPACLHRIRVTGGQVRLADRQGVALTGPTLRDTDASVAAWREAEVAACQERDRSSDDYERLCESYVPGGMAMEGWGDGWTRTIPLNVSGPEVAVPAHAGRMGFVVDGALYAVTFFGDHVAVDQLPN
jgi:hypothetical protein